MKCPGASTQCLRTLLSALSAGPSSKPYARAAVRQRSRRTPKYLAERILTSRAAFDEPVEAQTKRRSLACSHGLAGASSFAWEAYR
jgi:hypothetical protein